MKTMVVTYKDGHKETIQVAAENFWGYVGYNPRDELVVAWADGTVAEDKDDQRAVCEDRTGCVRQSPDGPRSQS